MSHPDTAAPTSIAQRAIALLADPTDHNLRQARDLLQRASDTVPYLGPAPHCFEYRRFGARTCLDARICGRCRPILDADAED
ncbi:hypothetical protein [Kitasatospora griseola]|uniref:hypothetical protein n=1 Tax=Kitasatospora griseola TaxID=2064 RepID=UPI00381C233B